MHIFAPPNELASTSNTTNPELRGALQTLPAYADATRRLASMTEACNAYSAKHIRTPDDVAADIADLIDKGKPLPDDLHAQIATTTAEAAADAQVRTLLSNVMGAIAADRDTAIRNGADVMCRHLHRRLLEAVQVIRAVTAEAPGVDTAEAAIEAGAVETWQRGQQARQQYTQVRDAQKQIVARLWRDDHIVNKEVLHFGNVLQVFPNWPAWSRYGYLEDGRGAKQYLQAPWPQITDPAFDPWLIHHDTARPWVPTLAAYRRAAEQLAASKRDENPASSNSYTSEEPASTFKAPASLPTRNIY